MCDAGDRGSALAAAWSWLDGAPASEKQHTVDAVWDELLYLFFMYGIPIADPSLMPVMCNVLHNNDVKYAINLVCSAARRPHTLVLTYSRRVAKFDKICVGDEHTKGALVFSLRNAITAIEWLANQRHINLYSESLGSEAEVVALAAEFHGLRETLAVVRKHAGAFYNYFDAADYMCQMRPRMCQNGARWAIVPLTGVLLHFNQHHEPLKLPDVPSTWWPLGATLDRVRSAKFAGLLPDKHAARIARGQSVGLDVDGQQSLSHILGISVPERPQIYPFQGFSWLSQRAWITKFAPMHPQAKPVGTGPFIAELTDSAPVVVCEHTGTGVVVRGPIPHEAAARVLAWEIAARVFGVPRGAWPGLAAVVVQKTACELYFADNEHCTDTDALVAQHALGLRWPERPRGRRRSDAYVEDAAGEPATSSALGSLNTTQCTELLQHMYAHFDENFRTMGDDILAMVHEMVIGSDSVAGVVLEAWRTDHEKIIFDVICVGMAFIKRAVEQQYSPAALRAAE